jgi:hypothetical protein
VDFLLTTKQVEASLRRDLPIVTTPHAKDALTSKSLAEDNFTAVTALDAWSTCLISTMSSPSSSSDKAIKVTATPGKHVPPGPAGLLEKANDIIHAIPPTNGWILELGRKEGEDSVKPGYTIYISGDTLMVDELKMIPEKFPHVDLMLVHLGEPLLNIDYESYLILICRWNYDPWSACPAPDGDHGRENGHPARPPHQARRDDPDPLR